MTKDIEEILRRALEAKNEPLSEAEIAKVREVLIGWQTLKAWGGLGKFLLWAIPGAGAAIVFLQGWLAQ